MAISDASNDELLAALGPARAAPQKAAFSIDDTTLDALRQVESRGNPNAVSNAGAIGAYQFMPKTAQQFGIDPRDEVASRGAAKKYLDQMTAQFGDPKLALLAYNWGPGNVAAYLKTGKGLAGQPMPDEAAQYAGKVLRMREAIAGGQAQPSMLARAGNAAASAISGTANASDLSSISTDELLKALDDRKANTAPAPKPEGVGLMRQLGLTGRYALEGAGNTLDMLSSPIRVGLNAVLPISMQIKPGIGESAANAIGLPSPQNGGERIVGDLARGLAGAAVPVGLAAGLAKGATGATQTAANALASSPGMQLLSGAGGGAAGGYTREQGGTEGEQAAASLLGAVAAPAAAGGLLAAGRSVAGYAQRMLPANQAAQAQTVNVTINNALQGSGMTAADLAPSVLAGLQRDVAEALSIGGAVSPAAVRRLADYRMTGATPTMGSLTLDPAIVSQQKNLAKIGINSKDGAAQQLGRVEGANNQNIIGNLNALGAANAGDQIAGANPIMAALSARNDRAKSVIGQFYDAARNSQGRAADLNPQHFATTANDALDQALLGGKLPADVRGLLNKAATGEMPLTVDTAEQFKTRIGDLQRASHDAAERKALGIVRGALDQTPLLDPSQMGQVAIDAFTKARTINRAWMGIVDRTPALQAIREGVEPDKFVQTFIIGQGGKANVMDVAALKSSIKSNQEAMDAVKGQIVSYLKTKALSGAADEVGNVSQSGLNKALTQIGDRKLALFFSADEINALKANARVASYEQVQPRGSAVNNSNTAGSGIASVLNWAANSPLLSKIPFGGVLQGPAQNISVGLQAGRNLNVPRSLAIDGQSLLPASPRTGLLLSPAAFAGMVPDDERRRQGLLSP